MCVCDERRIYAFKREQSLMMEATRLAGLTRVRAGRCYRCERWVIASAPGVRGVVNCGHGDGVGG